MVNELRYNYSLSVLVLMFFVSCADNKKPDLNDLAETQTSSEVMTAFSEKQKAPAAKTSQKLNEIEYSAQWVPPVVMAARAGEPNAKPSDLDDYDDFINVDLSITTPGHLEFLKFDLYEGNEYDRRVKYSAFEMQRDIWFITESNDTIDCLIYHFERNFDASPVGKFTLGFPCEKCTSGTLVFEDRLFNNGRIKLLINRHENT
jgi:hypothetical protein